MSTEYPKINSIFKRNPDDAYKSFLMGEFSEPEFDYLRNLDWLWTEKVDGTNIRIGYLPTEAPDSVFGVSINGRTERAVIPNKLYARLTELFPTELLAKVFPKEEGRIGPPVVLYGEGYGAGIQKSGGGYIPDGVDFILFDVRIGDLWLSYDNVVDIANKLGIKYVPMVGIGNIWGAMALTAAGFKSKLRGATCAAEGLVLKPVIPLLNSRGNRIITKVKTVDFNH